MEILVIDGQGGGLGRQLVAAVKKAVPQAVVTAIGKYGITRSCSLAYSSNNSTRTYSNNTGIQ